MTTLSDTTHPLAPNDTGGAAVIHLRQPDADGAPLEVPIGCRHNRRLGQHAALQASGPVGLDSYLSRQRAHSTAQRRIVVISAEHRDQMLAALTTHASSAVVVRITPDIEDADQQVEHWMLDQDQLAALLGEHWVKGRETKLRPCCGSWVAAARSLRAPAPVLGQAQTRKTGKEIRNELGDFSAYGDVLDEPEVPEGSREFRIRASIGSGSGRPGIQLNADHLECLRSTLKVPDLDFGSWVSVVREFHSAVGPDELRVPATLRERPTSHRLDRREVGVDQVIRVALGVTEWEKVSLEAIVGEHWANWNGERETPQIREPRAGDRLANRWRLRYTSWPGSNRQNSPSPNNEPACSRHSRWTPSG